MHSGQPELSDLNSVQIAHKEEAVIRWALSVPPYIHFFPLIWSQVTMAADWVS